MKKIASTYCEFLDRQGPTFNTVAGVLCTVLLGLFDYYTDTRFGPEYTLELFYLLPVAFVAWFAGRKAAIAIALTCTASKILVQGFFPEPLSLMLWRNGSAFGFFLVVGLLLAKMRELLNYERILSRLDHLTGAFNRRAFLEVTTNEIFRLDRHGPPFTIAYIDLDNFKEINDTYDHSTGDRLLRTVVSTITRHLRRTDTVARLGGDEFAILFTNTGEQEARVAVRKIREQLQLSVKELQLAVTFSIGVLTCNSAPETVDEIISLADNLMYTVKKSGKDGVRHAVYAQDAVTG